MISAGEFRNGVTMEYEGEIYVILEFQHVKPGKGAAFVRTKIKNLKTGAVVEKTFRPTEKMPRAHIDRQDMQYLYSDGDLYHFMNVETFDQIAVNAEDIGDALKFVKENDMVKILSYEGQVFGISQKSSGIDTVTTCYAAGAAFAMAQKINALSLGDAALLLW